MDVKGFISEAYKFKRIELGSREQLFLTLIADEDSISAYKLHSLLKTKGISMAYKNVHKRVKRLEHLSLINEVKGGGRGDSFHGAKFYRLTSEGLFYLLHRVSPILPGWLVRYNDSVILKTLLFPYFEESSLNLLGVNIEIGRYLQGCCEIILSTLEIIKLAAAPSKIQNKALRQLEIDLRWEAKALAFKIVTKDTRFLSLFETLTNKYWFHTKTKTQTKDSFDNRTAAVEEDTFSPPLALAHDKKFMEFSDNLGTEYQRLYTKLIQSRKQLKESL